MNYFDGKIVDLLMYFTANCAQDVCDKVHLLKLMYLADRDHMRECGRRITSGSYLAYPKGPVNKRAYEILVSADSGHCDELREYLIALDDEGHHKYISDKVGYRYPHLSLSDRQSADCAIETMLQLASKGEDLSEFTHHFPEWSKVKDKIDDAHRVYPEIDIADFFADPDEPGKEYSKASPALVALNKDSFLNY